MTLDQIGNYKFIEGAIETFLDSYEYTHEDDEDRIMYLFWRQAPERCKCEYGKLKADRMYELSVKIVLTTAIRRRKKEFKIAEEM